MGLDLRRWFRCPPLPQKNLRSPGTTIFILCLGFGSKLYLLHISASRPLFDRFLFLRRLEVSCLRWKWNQVLQNWLCGTGTVRICGCSVPWSKTTGWSLRCCNQFWEPVRTQICPLKWPFTNFRTRTSTRRQGCHHQCLRVNNKVGVTWRTCLSFTQGPASPLFSNTPSNSSSGGIRPYSHKLSFAYWFWIPPSPGGSIYFCQ